MVELPENLEDLFRYYDAEDADKTKMPWQTTYRRKEGASSKRRHDALFSETFIYQPSDNKSNDDKGLDGLLSLIKVPPKITRLI